MIKGGKRAGPGRPKGTPNRVTTDFRATVTKILEGHLDDIDVWLKRVAKKEPYRALDLLMRLAEFTAPKLGRIEVTGQGGRDFVVNIVDPTRREAIPGQLIKPVESADTSEA